MIRTVLNMSSSLQQVIVDTHYEKKIESTKTVEVMKPIISRGGGVTTSELTMRALSCIMMDIWETLEIVIEMLRISAWGSLWL
jgi:hypothetical protein